MRLNKFIAETGYCSRRQADALIAEGRVTVNGQPAEMGQQADAKDQVMVDGQVVELVEKKLYLALNKPVGIECTSNRAVKGNIIDFIKRRERVFPVGRLDKNSEGLILLTNDGDLSNQLLKAAHYHEKEYIVEVDQTITPAFLKHMREGVAILDTVTRPCQVDQLSKRRFRIVLTQGLNRQIRRMCDALGYQVLTLKRVRIVNVLLGDLKCGQHRDLTPQELQLLKKELGLLDE